MATRYSAVRNPASSLWSRFQDSMTPSIPSILFSRREHPEIWPAAIFLVIELYFSLVLLSYALAPSMHFTGNMTTKEGWAATVMGIPLSPSP
ncbi:hypothetical protein RHSIM_Rhsim12G0180000 [Rhododendron simsii]|uniref:Uncharacterized protein n=1 Tax=Rhododendron simsii TaxID=118357 RepID=A0A834G406_RHOSS|nr:hypothetical protein RHSIM_Rhsim12G0180000 [Rhododendron simsii]